MRHLREESEGGEGVFVGTGERVGFGLELYEAEGVEGVCEVVLRGRLWMRK